MNNKIDVCKIEKEEFGYTPFFDDEERVCMLRCVVEMLREMADYTEKTEPYATKAINRMRIAAGEVRDLIDYLDLE